MKTLVIAGTTAVALAFGAIVPTVRGDDPPPPPLPTKYTPVASAPPATAQVLSTVINDQDPTPMPPPPLPTRLTPTAGPAAPIKVSIKSVAIFRHVGTTFEQTKTLYRNDMARFVVRWGASAHNSLPIAGVVSIQKNGHTLYHQILHGNRAGALSGTMFADIRLNAANTTGHLTATFAITAGHKVQRTIRFLVLPLTGR